MRKNEFNITFDSMSDRAIAELYKLDRKAGNTAAINKYNNYIYTIINSFQIPFLFPEVKEELHQAGCVGIMEALPKYDANKGYFYNYFYNYVRHEISKQIRFFEGETTEHFARLHRIIMRARDEIQKEKGTVSIDDIMERTGKSRKLVRRELGIDYTKTSYDQLGDRI